MTDVVRLAKCDPKRRLALLAVNLSMTGFKSVYMVMSLASLGLISMCAHASTADDPLFASVLKAAIEHRLNTQGEQFTWGGVIRTEFSARGALTSWQTARFMTWILRQNDVEFQVRCEVVIERAESDSEFKLWTTGCQAPSQVTSLVDYLPGLFSSLPFEVFDGRVRIRGSLNLGRRLQRYRAALPPSDYPSQACRLDYEAPNGHRQTFCGGSLIQGQRILTARHCFWEHGRWNLPVDGVVTVACGNGERHVITQRQIVLSEDDGRISADAALIHLSGPSHSPGLLVLSSEAEILKMLKTSQQCGIFVSAQRPPLPFGTMIGIPVNPSNIHFGRYWGIEFLKTLTIESARAPVKFQDSGGLLACKDANHHWVQIGLLSGQNEMTGAIILNPGSNFANLLGGP